MSTYFTFGDLTSGNLVLSYPSQDIAVGFANLAIVFIVTAGSPLKIHPARQSLTTLTCYFLSAGSWEDTREWCGGKFPKFIYVLNTSTVLISFFFTAMIITDLGVLFSIIGAVASTGLMFYIPGLAFFKLFAEDMPRERPNAEKTRSSVETKKADAGKADDRNFQPIFTYGWLKFHRWVALCLGILGLVVMVVSLVTIGLSSLPMLI
jgi:amino acid permease